MGGFLKDVGYELGFEEQLDQWWVAGKACRMLGMHGDAGVVLSASKSARNVTSTSLTLEALYSFRVKMEGNYIDADTGKQ